MNIKKRAIGLAATVGLLGGVFAMGAPAAHAATVIGGCSGIKFIGTIVPPLAGDGTPTAVVAATKTAKAGTVEWGVGFSFSETETGAGSCSIGYGPGAFSASDMLVGAKLSGVATCNSALPQAPPQYPLNGKIKLNNVAKTDVLQGYIRVAGFDPVPGPDVIALTGIVTKGNAPGATINGEVAFDPVKKAAVNGEAGGPELKGQYYFDNSQVANPCGTPTGGSIGIIAGGDGLSLLGSVAAGMDFEF